MPFSLMSIFYAGRGTQGVQTVSEQVQWNLQLTIDWKRPDLAVSEIFNKYKENILVSKTMLYKPLSKTELWKTPVTLGHFLNNVL